MSGNFEFLSSRFEELQGDYYSDFLNNTASQQVFYREDAKAAISRAREIVKLIQNALEDELTPEQANEIDSTFLFDADCLLSNAGSSFQTILTPEEYDVICDRINELAPTPPTNVDGFGCCNM